MHSRSCLASYLHLCASHVHGHGSSLVPSMRGPLQNVISETKSAVRVAPSQLDWLKGWHSANGGPPLYDIRLFGAHPFVVGATRFHGIDGANGDSISARQHELPSPEKRFNVFAGLLSSSDEDGRKGESFLCERGYAGVVLVRIADIEAHCPGAIASHCQSRQLWSPSPTVLELVPQVETFLRNDGAQPPLSLLDVGAGAGRDAAFAAWRGWNVLAIDRCASLVAKCEALGSRIDQDMCFDVGSREAAGLDSGRQYGTVKGITRTFGTSLSDDAHFLRENAAHLLLVVRFLRRGVLELLPLGVRAKGFVIIEHFLTGCELLGGPMKKSQMLERGELGKLFGSHGFNVLKEDELTLADGRPVVRFLAQRRD